MKVKSESEVAQSCLTLRDPMDCSLLGSSAHGIFQARVLEWSAIAFSKFLVYNLVIGYYILFKPITRINLVTKYYHIKILHGYWLSSSYCLFHNCASFILQLEVCISPIFPTSILLPNNKYLFVLCELVSVFLMFFHFFCLFRYHIQVKSYIYIYIHIYIHTYSICFSLSDLFHLIPSQCIRALANGMISFFFMVG